MKEKQESAKDVNKEEINLENNLKELNEALNKFAHTAKDFPECSIKVFIDEQVLNHFLLKNYLHKLLVYCLLNK